jgi:glutamine amidotransferase
MLKVIAQINAFIKDIPEKTVMEEDVDTRSLLNFAVTDGHSVICTRYVSSRTDEAASLYYSSGTTWEDKKKGNFQMDRRDKGADIVLVASEPLTFERDNWVTVPTNSTLTIHNQTVMVHPILDEYYNKDPSYKRSSQLVVEKGLIATNAPAAKAAPSPSAPSASLGGKTNGRAQVVASGSSPAAKPAQPPSSRLAGTGLLPRVSPDRQQENGFGRISPIANLSPLSARDPTKPAEQGNTKKKRVSIAEADVQLGEPELDLPVGALSLQPGTWTANRAPGSAASSSSERTAYGSPAKINQYFPELS